MDDDWDAVAITNPPQSSLVTQGGVKPPGGRGRGVPHLSNQMNNVKISSGNDWQVGVQAKETNNNVAGWGSAPSKAPVNDSWNVETPATPNVPDRTIDNSWHAGAAAAKAPAQTIDDSWNVGPSSSTAVSSSKPAASVPDNSWMVDPSPRKEPEPRGGGWDTAASSGGGWNSSGGGTGGGGGGWNSSGGGGSSRACHKCGEEGHMSRECPKGGGGGSRACHKCGEEGHMSRECPSGGGGAGGRGCFKCGEEGHMSRECPKSGGGGGGSRACHKCGEEGHMSRECPTGGGGGSRACHKCGEEGHMSRECPTGGGGGSRACHKCGEEGHMSRECPTGGGGGDGKCFKCHEAGHLSRDCPNPFSEVTEDGKPREAYNPPDVTTDTAELFKGISAGRNFANFDNVALQITGPDVPQYITSFETAGLRELVLNNIKASGYVKPTPIQKGSIAVVLAKRDLIASAVTGSGKTAAYLIPVINMLLEQKVDGAPHDRTQKPEVIIIAPTRELVIQIHRETCKFAHNSILKPVIVYGGTVVRTQMSNLQNGCNILVATPGRLKDFVSKNALDFSNLKFFILDEADRMLDEKFLQELDTVMNHPTMPPKGKRQTLMFSATFPSQVQDIARKHMQPDYVFVNTGSVGGTNPDVQQEFFELGKKDKRNKLMEILQEIGTAKVIIFVETKKNADYLASFICNSQLQATSIHGDRLQSQREQALRDFKLGTRNVLVATNVAARGLDIEGVEYVINYELPSDIEEYVHRIGRTGRVGNSGRSISFFDPDKDAPNAARLIETLVKSNSDIPSFLQQYGSGIGSMGYNFGAPSGTNFSSRDDRRFGDKPAVAEVEETWD